MRRPTSTPPTLPGYEYTKLLGSGGFSDVFLYEQQLPRRSVAVKVLHAADADANERSLAEARVLAKLAHPNVIAVHAAGEEAGCGAGVVEVQSEA